MSTDADKIEDRADEERRKFLASCGRFAAVTPPAITLLLSTSLNSNAVAASAGGAGHRNHPDPQPTHGKD
jgi:hypothetical protein